MFELAAAADLVDGQIKMFQKLNKEGAFCFAMSFIWGYRVKKELMA